MHFRRSAPAQPDPRGPVSERDYFGAAVGWLTCQIIAFRFQLENERNERHRLMAIEIKGLKLQAMTARGHLDRLSQAYAKFNEAAPAHAADVEGMAEQVTEMQSDLEFATNLLGNSNAVSGNGTLKTAEMPKEPPAAVKGATVADLVDATLPEGPLVRLGPNPSGLSDKEIATFVETAQRYEQTGKISAPSAEVAGEASLTFPAV